MQKDSSATSYMPGVTMQTQTLLSPKEILDQAGLNWEVRKERLYLGDAHEAMGYLATVRQDTRQVLGVVSPRYQVIQNESMTNAVTSVLEGLDASFRSGGSYNGGSNVFLTIDLPRKTEVVKGDVIGHSLSFSSSHDGSAKYKVQVQMLRLVCLNGMTAGETEFFDSVKHNSKSVYSLSKFRNYLDNLEVVYNRYIDKIRSLTLRMVTKEEIEQYVKNLGFDRDSTRAENATEQVIRLMNNGKGNDLPGVRGTAWAMFNGVTEFVDHYRIGDEQKRMISAQYGSGADLKERAMEEALVLARS